MNYASSNFSLEEQADFEEMGRQAIDGRDNKREYYLETPISELPPEIRKFILHICYSSLEAQDSSEKEDGFRF